MKPGYLRKNGVPYSANAMLTEYYTRTNESNGDSWLIITTIVDDPMYLAQPFITSDNFKGRGSQRLEVHADGVHVEVARHGGFKSRSFGRFATQDDSSKF